jgi:hypothetical protein
MLDPFENIDYEVLSVLYAVDVPPCLRGRRTQESQEDKWRSNAKYADALK